MLTVLAIDIINNNKESSLATRLKLRLEVLDNNVNPEVTLFAIKVLSPGKLTENISLNEKK